MVSHTLGSVQPGGHAVIACSYSAMRCERYGENRWLVPFDSKLSPLQDRRAQSRGACPSMYRRGSSTGWSLNINYSPLPSAMAGCQLARSSAWSSTRGGPAALVASKIRRSYIRCDSRSAVSSAAAEVPMGPAKAGHTVGIVRKTRRVFTCAQRERKHVRTCLGVESGGCR